MRRSTLNNLILGIGFIGLTGIFSAIYWNSGYDIIGIAFAAMQSSILITCIVALVCYRVRDYLREQRVEQIRQARKRRASFRNVIISPKFLELPTNESGVVEIVQREW